MSGVRARTWPTFNEAAACPKCAHTEITAHWCQKGDYARLLSVFDRDQADWIQRHCDRCHYEWPEEPLDRIEPAAPTKAADAAKEAPKP